MTKATEFVEHGELCEDGYGIGGDGTGQAWSRRFTRTNDKGQLEVLTCYAYTVDRVECGLMEDEDEDGNPVPEYDRWDVETLDTLETFDVTLEEWERGDYISELDTEYNREFPFYVGTESETQAEEWARNVLKRITLDMINA